MNLISHQHSQALINHLVALQRALALESRPDDDSGKMRIIVALDFYGSAIKAVTN